MTHRRAIPGTHREIIEGDEKPQCSAMAVKDLPGGARMPKTLQHEGYTGCVEFSEEDGVFLGKLVGIRDAVTCEGKDLKSLPRNFRRVVHEYLTFCDAEGKTPEKARRDSPK